MVLFLDYRGKYADDRYTGRAHAGCVIFFPINAPDMGRFQLLNLGVLGYGLDSLELRFWVVIAIIVSLTLTITTIVTII